jgi:hypothetical protein
MPLTNSVLRTIDWRNEKGKRYMNYLKHDEGEKYIEGCTEGSCGDTLSMTTDNATLSALL